MTLDEQILTGLTESHIVSYDTSRVHKAVIGPLQKLEGALKENGFELGIASSFRSFDSQAKIWNTKARGERTLLDKDSNPLDFAKLSSEEVLHAILRWSALPGLSRHHWGTDFDVYDKKTQPEGYRIQLISSEFEGQGYFSKMHAWLDKNMQQYGFFRPYQKDLGGVSPERWHISYFPLAEKLLKMHSQELVTQVWADSDLELKDLVLSEVNALFKRYFLNITPS